LQRRELESAGKHRYDYYEYDPNGNRTAITDPEGNLTRVTNAIGQSHMYEYDAVGHVTSMTDTLGHVTQYEYSLGGKLTAVTDAAGNKTEYAYDLMGNLITVCQHEGSRTLLSADAQKGRGEAFGHAGGEKLHITRYERDLMGNVTTVINPLGQKEHYAYDEAGHLLSKTDRDGYQTNYRYNGRGDLEEISYNDSRSVQYSYNALRQLTEIKDWLGITRIELDEAGRAKQITDHKGREVRYQWGRLGERTGLVYPDGRKVSYEYDEWSRLSHLIDGNREIQYHYREDGRLSEKVFSDGLITSYDYNEMGLISSLTHQQGEKKLEQYRYTYDCMGNKTRIEKSRAECFRAEGVPEEISRKLSQERGIYQYRYDKLNRLTEVLHGNETVSSYVYDAFGNRIQSKHGYEERRYEYNAANQLLRSVTGGRVECCQYDKRGNLTEIIQDDRAIYRYRYDETNRLAEAVNGSGQAVRYEYNGLGNRVGRKEYRLEGFAGGGSLPENPALPKDPVRETEYLLDLTKPYHNLLERRENTEGEIVSQIYTWDSNVVYATEGESAYMYLQDELGSPVRLVGVQGDNSKGTQQTVYGYDEFGNDRYGNQGEVQPFGFTGYQRDVVTNTYFAQAREYLPKEGRFGGEDWIKGSISRPFTLNSYGYCWGNPVTLIDLDGRFPTWSEVKDMIEDNTVGRIRDKIYDVSGTEITNKEIALLALYPDEGWKVFECGKKAEEWTNRVFSDYYQAIEDGLPPHWQDGDAANAYRHAMWNALLTQQIGSTNTKIWTDAHEAWPDEVMQKEHGGGFKRIDHTIMDYHNNEVGRSVVGWFENVSEQEISERIIEKLREGELIYIVDEGWYDEFIGCSITQ